MRVQTYQVERVSEAMGAQVEAAGTQDREEMLSGKVEPMNSVSKLYITIDATGVPVVPQDVEGRVGKDPSGPT